MWWMSRSEQAGAHVAEVFRVLGEIGAAATPQILVLNKCDRFVCRRGATTLRCWGPVCWLRRGRASPLPPFWSAALPAKGWLACFDRIDAALPFERVETVRFRIPLRDGAAIALLHERGKVRAQDYHGNLCEIEVEAPESLRRRLKRYLVRKSPPACGKFCAQVKDAIRKALCYQRFFRFEPKRSNRREPLVLNQLTW